MDKSTLAGLRKTAAATPTGETSTPEQRAAKQRKKWVIVKDSPEFVGDSLTMRLVHKSGEADNKRAEIERPSSRFATYGLDDLADIAEGAIVISEALSK